METTIDIIKPSRENEKRKETILKQMGQHKMHNILRNAIIHI